MTGSQKSSHGWTTHYTLVLSPRIVYFSRQFEGLREATLEFYESMFMIIQLLMGGVVAGSDSI